MAAIPTQIRIDAKVKEEASALFENLGLDMSSAVNMFLHQCILRGGLPFAVEMPMYNVKTLEAIDEARRISRDPNAKAFDNIDSLKAELDESPNSAKTVRKEKQMKDDFDERETAMALEALVKIVKENQTRIILEIIEESETLDEALENVRALLEEKTSM